MKYPVERFQFLNQVVGTKKLVRYDALNSRMKGTLVDLEDGCNDVFNEVVVFD